MKASVKDSITPDGFSQKQGDFIESSKRVAPCMGLKTFLDSGFDVMDSGFQVWIPVFVCGTKILDTSLRWAGSGLVVGFRIL